MSLVCQYRFFFGRGIERLFEVLREVSGELGGFSTATGMTPLGAVRIGYVHLPRRAFAGLIALSAEFCTSRRARS